METRHYILLLIYSSSDQKIQSKTKIQKELYLFEHFFKRKFSFKAYYYGPYSSVVENGLDELIGLGFVSVATYVYGIDVNRGFELKRYDYSLTESGKKFAEELISENKQEYSKIENFVQKIEKLRNHDYLTLSVAAKAHFSLSEENRPMKHDEIMNKMKSFGWQVNDEDYENAVEVLKELNFVEEIQS